MAHLTSLTNEELLAHGYTQFNTITGTDLEAELLRRFGHLIDEVEELDNVVEVLDRHNLASAELTTMFELLDEFSVTDPKSLRQKLERADQWYELADEAGDLFSRLVGLQKSTL